MINKKIKRGYVVRDNKVYYLEKFPCNPTQYELLVKISEKNNDKIDNNLECPEKEKTELCEMVRSLNKMQNEINKITKNICMCK